MTTARTLASCGDSWPHAVPMRFCMFLIAPWTAFAAFDLLIPSRSPIDRTVSSASQRVGTTWILNGDRICLEETPNGRSADPLLCKARLIMRIFSIFHPGVFTIMHPLFSLSCTHHFHHHAPIVFMIIHPPCGFHSSVSSSLLPPWQWTPFDTGGSRPLALRWPDFEAKARFVHEVQKKSLLESRGCIFSRSPIVQLVAFWLIFGADPTAVRLR